MGDQDNDGDIRGDEDDRDLLDGPHVLTTVTPELYLIDPEHNKRTYLRFIVQDDPYRPSHIDPCEVSTDTVTGNVTMTGGCLGNIQMLKMEGYDLGSSHEGSMSTGTFDGQIDTWVCAENWPCDGHVLAHIGGRAIATGSGSEWINLFPNSIHVRNLRFELFPKKDPWLAARAPDPDPINNESPYIHPYVRVSLEIGFSYSKRRILRDHNPVLSFSTTISLDDFR